MDFLVKFFWWFPQTCHFISVGGDAHIAPADQGIFKKGRCGNRPLDLFLHAQQGGGQPPCPAMVTEISYSQNRQLMRMGEWTAFNHGCVIFGVQGFLRHRHGCGKEKAVPIKNYWNWQLIFLAISCKIKLRSLGYHLGYQMQKPCTTIL